MKKRIMSFVLAAALTMGASVSAFAMDLPYPSKVSEDAVTVDGNVMMSGAKEDAANAVSTFAVEESFDVMDPDSYVVPFDVMISYYQLEAQKMLAYINQARANVGAPALTWDRQLEAYAATRAAELLFDFDNKRPNTLPWYSLNPSRLERELIAGGYDNAKELFDAWMQDPTYQSFILDPSYRSIGVSYGQIPGSEYIHYWTVHFSGTAGDGNHLTDIEPENTKLPVEVMGDESTRQVRNYVIRLYSEVLGRMPDLFGLSSWNTQLALGYETGAKTAHGFVFSDEFKNKNTSNEAYIRVLYRTILGREADAGGLAAWKKLLDGGLSRTYIFHGLCESPEFTELCASYGIVRGNVDLTEPRDQNSGLTLFISRLYQYVLDRSADEGGLNAWTNQILTGQETPETVAYGIVFSPEFKNKHTSDGEYVQILYRVFMDRNADPAGYKAWTDALARGESREHVLFGFSKSPEFGEILRKFGL